MPVLESTCTLLTWAYTLGHKTLLIDTGTRDNNEALQNFQNEIQS